MPLIVKILTTLLISFTLSKFAVAQSHSDWDSNNQKALDYYDNNNLDSALAYFKRGIELSEHIHQQTNQNQITNYYNLGYIYAQLGNCTDAIINYDKAIDGAKKQYSPDSDYIAEILEVKARCLQSDDKAEDLAMNYLERSKLELSIPEQAALINFAGMAYTRIPDYNSSIECFKTAFLLLNKNDSSYIETAVYAGNVGYVYRRLENRDSSIKYLWEGAKVHERLGKTDTLPYGNLVLYLGDELYQVGDYKPAISNYIIAYRNYILDEKTNIENVLLSLDRLVLAYKASGNNTQAVAHSELKLEHIKNVYGKQDDQYIELLESIIPDNISSGYYKDALVFTKEFKTISVNKYGTKSKKHLKTLLNISEWYTLCGEHMKAKKSLSETDKWIKDNTPLLDTADQVYSYYRIARSYDRLDEEEKQIEAILKGSHLASGKNNYVDEQLYFSAKLGDYYSSLDSTNKALVHYIEAERVYKNLNKTLGTDYLPIAKNLASAYAKTKNTSKAKHYARIENSLAKELKGKNSLEYFYSFYTLVSTYYDLEEHDSASYYLNEAYNAKYIGTEQFFYESQMLLLNSYKTLLKIKTNKSINTHTEDLATGNVTKALSQLMDKRLDQDEISREKSSSDLKNIDAANYLFLSGNLNDAKAQYEDILATSKRILGETSIETALLNKQLSSICIRLKQFQSASEYINVALVQIKNFLGEDHLLYYEVLLDQAWLSVEIGQHDKAFRLINELTLSTEDKFGASSYQNLRAWLLWGMLNNEVDNYQRAMDAIFYIEAVAKDNPQLQQVYAESQIEYVKLRKKMGLTGIGFASRYNSTIMGPEYYQKVNKEGIALIDKAVAIITKTEGTSSPTIAFLNCEKAYLMALNSDGDEAKIVFDTYLPNVAKRYGKQHPEYRRQLQNLGYLYHIYGNWVEAVDYYMEANEILIHELTDVFSFSGEMHRKSYLDKIEYQFDKMQQFDFQSNNVSSQLTEQSLNNHLTLKGLLLNNQKNILDNLLSLNKPHITTLVEEYRRVKLDLGEQIFLPNHLQTKPIYFLINSRDSLENLMITEHIRSFPNYTIETGDWKKIQAKLKKDEVAIEFSQFHYDDVEHFPNRVQYVAYIIKPGIDHPIVVYLGKEKEMKELLEFGNPNGLYASRGIVVESTNVESPKFENSIYDLVWKPLEYHLLQTKTVYYSTSGVLNKIPFAALKDSSNATLCAKYNLRQYNVFSTSNFTQNTSDDALIIGGLKYTDDKAISQVKKLRKSTWNYLQGTYTEAETISKLLSSSISTTWMNDTAGTEEYIKSITGKSPSIIHIATHGYYSPDTMGEIAEHMRYFTSLKPDPMMRSGLLLSYASQAWTYGINESRKEDGILNSAEIANLDFSNTQLVVLSACETGLGDIDGNEGVMGLQRGFRMAGVNNLIVSLWPVLDKETAEFMTLFYSNLINIHNIRDAFNSTQRTMYEKYSDEPYKWAGFVLIE